MVSVTDADGATRTAAFNAQGKQIGAQDANGKLATWSYDAFGQLTGHTDIGGASYQFGYDAARQLVSQTNSRGQNLAYRYDAAGQLTEIDDKSALNQQTYYAYNAAGQHVLEQTVQGGVTYQNQVVAYDTLGRLAHVEGMDGVKLDITYDKVGNKLRQTTTYNTESQRTVADYGQVLQTDESGNPVLDDAGNPVYATVQIGSHTVYDATAHAQDQWFAYDAMNRQILVDGAVNGNAGDLSNLTAGQGHILSYDRNGNRISDESWGTAVVPEYSQNTDASGAPTGDPYLAGYTTHTGVITTWYGYDSLNRLSTVSTGAYGQQQTGTVQKVVPQVDESGNPVLDESGNPITNTVTTPVYSEVALDQSHAVTLDVRRYDGANRVVSSGPVNLPPNGTGVASGTIVSSGNTGPLHASYIEALAGSNTNQPGSTATTTRYDAAGRVLSQHVVNEVDGTRSYDVSYEKTVVTGTHTVQVQTGTAPVLDEAGAPVLDESGSAVTTPVYTTQTVTDTAEVSTYDAAGNALGYRVTQNGTTTDYTFSQALYEGYQEGGVSAVSSAGSSGSTGEQYDANGFLVGLTDSTQGANNRSFVNDANGHILQKNQQGNLLNQLVVNGQVMGIYGVGTDAITPTNSDGNPNYTTQGNFDLGYQPVTNSYPAAATGQYPVKSGDTLQSIAQSAYGDSQLWYQIAQANGLSGNADLRVGQIINIPTRVGGTHNTANTFAPYDPSKVEGSTSPNLPTPSSDDGGGCGVIGQVIMIVVAVVVTIYTAGAAAGAFGAVATGTAGTTAGAVAGTEAALGATAAGTVGGTFTTGLAAMAGGYGAAGVGAVVVGGAVGSIASQAVGNAIGAQHGFSWDQVALSGLAAGVSAGVGAAASGAPLAATQGGAGIAAGIGRAAIGSVVTQGVSVAVGLQDHFSWQQVAASAAGGGVGAAVGEMASSALAGSGLNAGVQGLVAGTVAGIASGTTAAVMRGGRVQIAQIAADAFGNALGQSIAEANLPSPAWDGSLYGSAPGYNYLGNVRPTGIFVGAGAGDPAIPEVQNPDGSWTPPGAPSALLPAGPSGGDALGNMVVNQMQGDSIGKTAPTQPTRLQGNELAAGPASDASGQWVTVVHASRSTGKVWSEQVWESNSNSGPEQQASTPPDAGDGVTSRMEAPQGIFAQRYGMATGIMADPSLSWDQRLGGLGLATAVAPMMLAEGVGRGMLNIPADISEGFQYLGRSATARTVGDSFHYADLAAGRFLSAGLNAVGAGAAAKTAAVELKGVYDAVAPRVGEALVAGAEAIGPSIEAMASRYPLVFGPSLKLGIVADGPGPMAVRETTDAAVATNSARGIFLETGSGSS